MSALLRLLVAVIKRDFRAPLYPYRLMACVGIVVVAMPTAGFSQPLPVLNWTGFYIGGHLGGQWLNSTHANAYSSPIGGTVSSGLAEIADGRFIGGALVGFNWQVSRHIVAGIEADVSWTDHNASGVIVRNPVDSREHYDGRSRLKTQGSVRGRIGYTGSPWLVYITGGVAFAAAEMASITVYDGVGSVAYSTSRTLTGLTAGGGIDYRLGPNWIFGIEYRYTNFGSLSVTTPSVTFPTDVLSYTATADFRTHGVHVRLIHKFGGPAPLP